MTDIKSIKDINNKTDIFNNIIYYNDNINDLKNIYEDFERNTPGAFILCDSLSSFKLVREEILKENKKEKNIKFNLILGEINIEQFNNFLNENKDLLNIIQNIYI